jgi:dihydrodipicolinate synthase/N-acetylneuraminate lyase
MAYGAGTDLAERRRPGRTIVGMAAVLLPFDESGAIDWGGLARHVDRTLAAGLVPAVNMDTGFGPSLGTADRARVLHVAGGCASGRFVAGAIVDDRPGQPFAPDRYRAEMAAVAESGGVPIIFPSFGLAGLPEGDLVEAHQRIASAVDRCYGFELGTMFHPAGRVFDLTTFEDLLQIPQLAGAKHSSLRRGPELERLAVRDRVRPDFLVLSGNDLAIDQVVYGSDYLLGLATFAPDAFAARDSAWASGDELGFLELNDLLQYLGQFAFRPPVPAYRHSAAMFLACRGQLASDRTHPASPTRPGSDRAVLADIAERLERVLSGKT